MSDTKFTKGPWDWEYDNDTASVIQVFSSAEEEKGDPDICRIQHEPNANLIAAAPEMYAELKRDVDRIRLVLAEMHGKIVNEPLIAEFELKVKLLAKARGES